MALVTENFDDRFTVGRTGPGTVVGPNKRVTDAQDNRPRLTFDPVTGKYLGFLTEPERTNMIQGGPADMHSSLFVRQDATLIPNQEIAPDGTASMIYHQSRVVGSHVRQTFTLSTSTDYVCSAFIKLAPFNTGRTRLAFRDITGADWQGELQIAWTNGVPSTFGTTGTVNDIRYEDYGNGVYRISFQSVSDATNTNHGMYLYPDIVNGTGACYIWGFQLEEGSSLTSYIPSHPTWNSRSTEASYHDKDGVLRFAGVDELRNAGYKLINGAWTSVGIFIEAAETNEIKDSQDLTTASWSTTNAIILPQHAMAPDGTHSACKLVSDTTAGVVHNVAQAGISYTSGNAYVLSAYLKAAEQTWGRLLFNSAAFPVAVNAYFDLANGTIGALSASVDDVHMEDVGDGWYRCSVMATADATTTSNIIIYAAEANSDVIWDGDGESGIYVWGVQVEDQNATGGVGAATSYIRTPASFTSRSTTASYHDGTGTLRTAAIDEERPNFKLVDGIWLSAGMLYEAAATNRMARSEEFDTSWPKTNCSVTANAAVAPDGNTTADEIVEDSTAAVAHYLGQLETLANTNNHVCSVYLKQGSGTRGAYIRTNNEGPNIYIAVDLINGTIIEKGSDTQLVRADMEDVGSGWYRVWFTWAPTDTSVGFIIGLQEDNTARGDLDAYNGDGTSSIYAWGAQLEEGEYPTSYIATTTGDVTRSADVISSSTATRNADNITGVTTTRAAEDIECGGALFNSDPAWFNSSEGTLFIEFVPHSIDDTMDLLSLNDGSNSNRIMVRTSATGQPNCVVVSGGVTQAFFGNGLPNVVIGETTKIAIRYKANDFQLAANGDSGSGDTSGSLPTGIDRFSIFQSGTGTLRAHGTVKEFWYSPRAYDDTELQLVTAV